jgi:uncharacterized membrane protein
MSTRTMLVVTILIVVLAGAWSAWLYPTMPERVPTHWNMRGEVDGWGSRDMGAWLMPAMMAVMLALFLVLPLLSPVRYKIEPFRPVWNAVITLVMAMFGAMHVITMHASLHPHVDVGRLLIAVICLFLAAIGLFMPKVQRNFWMGVRTPWTLASEAVWRATHRVAAWTMGVGGVLGALAALAGIPPMFAPTLVIVSAIYPAFYSLWLYKRLEREGRLE